MTALNDETQTVIYDPYWPEAMIDPRALYAKLHDAGPIHYLPEYDAWAVSGFEAVWQITSDTKNFTFTGGSAPNSGLLREPSAKSFIQLPNEEYAARRRVLQPGYRKSSADLDEPRIREIAKSVLAPLIANGSGTMDVFADYTSRVTAQVAAYKAGVPADEAERVWRACGIFLNREPGQKGTTEANLAGVMEVHGYLYELLAKVRADPSLAFGDLASLLAARIDGEPLSDEDIVGDLMTILITGSETTEIASAATVLYLAQHPAQLAEVRADHSLISKAFLETLRYDHPTDLLCREVLREVEVGGQTLRPGQPVIMLWGAANRDEKEFPQADTFDIHRTYKRHLLFGHGQHKCIGEFLALRMGDVILDELFSAIGDYTVDFDACTRKYAEFVKGYNSVPISFQTR